MHADEQVNSAAARTRVARVAGVLMGLVFLVAGLPKAWDPVLFYWDVMPFTYLFNLDDTGRQFVARAALVLGPLECLVGLGLIFNWRRRLVYAVAGGLMLLFTAVVALAWTRGWDASCGCFGTLLERGAREAVVEDAVMLGLLALGWFAGQATRPARAWAPHVLAVAAVALVATAGVRFALEKERLAQSDLSAGVSLADLRVAGDEVGNLAKGDWLLVLLTPGCKRCQSAVADMNQLAPKTPVRIVALTYYQQDSDALAVFRATRHPKFPVGSVSKRDFIRLAWSHEVPRFALVRNGKVTRVWESHERPVLGDLKRQAPS
jgi:hypothetical protein